MKSTKAIRKELAIRREELISNGTKPTIALNQARQEMNIKYGYNWRNRDYLKPNNNQKHRDNTPTIYDDHPFGEHWMD